MVHYAIAILFFSTVVFAAEKPWNLPNQWKKLDQSLQRFQKVIEGNQCNQFEFKFKALEELKSEEEDALGEDRDNVELGMENVSRDNYLQFWLPDLLAEEIGGQCFVDPQDRDKTLGYQELNDLERLKVLIAITLSSLANRAESITVYSLSEDDVWTRVHSVFRLDGVTYSFSIGNYL